MKRPAFMFYPADWRKDPGLRVCSIAARGLWIDLLALMHEAEQYGHLIVNGAPVTDAQLARLVGESPALVTKLLKELESHNVFSRTEGGVIYSRRMVRDEHNREVRSQGGKLGGNPTLLARPKVIQKDKDKDNQKDKATNKGRSKVKPTPSVAVAVSGAEGTTSPPGAAGGDGSPTTWLTPYMAAWQAQYEGPMPVEPNVQALRWLEGKYGPEETLRRWTIMLASVRAQFASAAKLKSGWGDWAAPPAAVKGTIGVAPAVLGEAATLWQRYTDARLLSRLPREEYDRIGAELVTAGFYPTVAAFLDELRITQPWTIEARTDGFAINELARRLSQPRKAAS